MERLEFAAIKRDGETHSRGFREHSKIRASLRDADPYKQNPTDEEGFLTTTGRFVDRGEAREIGVASGQLGKMWETACRNVLSSDIDW